MVSLLAASLAILADVSADTERLELLGKATAAVRAAIPTAEGDPSRPTFHFRPPAQWMNDPNGTIYHDGWYHLFYQFNPFGDQWGNMHWGHARSRDMVHWEHLPLALWPSKSRGEDHVFSGSTFLNHAGEPTILYTSIGGRAPEQWAATPLDSALIDWGKSPANPVLTTAAHGETKIDEWRDPFLFQAEGGTYMLVGGAQNGRGIVAMYRARSEELTAWEYVGIVFRHPDAGLIECPNIAKIDGRWVLLVSVHGRVESFVGDLDLKERVFRSERRGVLADGSYASQLLTDQRGRTIHWAWLRTTHHRGWNGCMTLPSALSLSKDGTLLRQPITDLAKLRAREEKLANVSLRGTLDLSSKVEGNTAELAVEILPGTASSLVFRLGGATVTYDPKSRTLWTPGCFPVTLQALRNGRLQLRFFLDRSVLDVYADGGATTQISSIPFEPGAPLSLSAEGGEAKLVSLSLFSLRPAEFDLGRFGE